MKRRVQWQLGLLLVLALGAAWVTFSASRLILRSTSPEAIKLNDRIKVLTASVTKTTKPLVEAEQKKLDELKQSDRHEAQWTVIGLAFYLLMVMVMLERLSEKWVARAEDAVPKAPVTDTSPEFGELPHVSPEIIAHSPLTLLIEDLQDAALIDSQLHVSSQRASEVLQQAVDRLQPLIRARKVQLQSRVLSGGEFINSVPDFWIECDFNRTARALQHLIESAVKNAKPNELVALLVEKTEKDVLFLVADDGDGMEQKHLEDLLVSPIWESQSLGISLASNIARKIGGQIWGESKVGKGTKLYLRLPLTFGATLTGTQLKTDIASAGDESAQSLPQS